MVMGSCKTETTQMTTVYNQEGEGICLAYTLTDMTTITLVMSGKSRSGLRLSPQGLIDTKTVNPNIKRSIQYVTQEGLEEDLDYQHTRVSREIPFENAQEVFQTPANQRYRLQHIALHESNGDINIRLTTIKTLICDMFRDGGNRYPCIAGLRMYRLANSELAKQVARGEYIDPRTGVRGALYRPSDDDITKYERKKPHAMLIVGVNTDHEDPAMHYCEVKNSYGIEWGDEGFSRIPFDVIELVMIPTP